MMKKLKFFDQIFEAEFIYKTDDSIVGLTGNKEVFSFKGIADFSYFNLEEGQIFDVYGKTIEEKVTALEDENNFNMVALTELFEQNIKMQEENIMLRKQNEILQNENTSTMLAVTELYEIILNGGTA